MKKKRSRLGQGEQMIMQSVISEEDILRAYMRKLGRRGGSVNSPAQAAARMKGIDAALAARGLTRRKERER